MLFESRKILVGFRIKVTFDTSLKTENSYVFVNLSETPTIKDLLDSIKKRFGISKEIYVALDDCRLLNSEDNSVLIDVCEVKIVPCNNETNIPPSKTTLNCEVFQRNSLSEDDHVVQPIEMDQVSDKTEDSSVQIEESSCITKENETVPCVRENTNRKSRRFYSSIAETLKYLNQNYKPESENSSKVAKDVTSGRQNCEKEREMNAVKEQDTVDNAKESCYLNDTSFEKTSDEFIERRKRKRKRKQSKKPMPESDLSEVVNHTHDRYNESNSGTKINNLPTMSTRQHIFFTVEDDDVARDEKPPSNGDLSTDSCSQIRSFNKKARKLEASAEIMESNVFGTNGITDVTNGSTFKVTENENFEKTHTIPDSAAEPSAVPINQSFEFETKLTHKRDNSYVKHLESEDSDSLSTASTKHRTTRITSTDSQWKPSLNNDFFTKCKVKAKYGNNFQTKEIPSESAHPLSTLLMCKQLQAPVEYSVQFPQSNTLSRSRRSSCVSVDCNKPTNNTSITNGISAEPIDNGNENTNDCDECEVLCHYKIVGDAVLLRDPDGTWNALTENDASLKLQPVEEPLENQSITFQLLYLGPNMCPSMSNLICGKVISFQKTSGRLILNILPAFIDTLLKNFTEDPCLPDELVHITDNTYQISWIAVKNPRLLM